MDIDTIINFWRIDEHFSSFILINSKYVIPALESQVKTVN